MCSRVLGLARDQIFAGFFGAGANTDAFQMAFRVPNLLRDLFAEGALSTAFITVFSRKIAKDGDRSAWALANKVATLTLVFMSAVSLLGIVLSPQLISVLARGFSPEKAALTVQLTRVMFPFILMVSLAALTMGMLNAKEVFGAPAMASSFFNLGSIVGGVTLSYLLEPQADWRHPHFGSRALLGMAIGTLIGGFLQFVVQLPPLRKVGYRFKPDFRWTNDEGLRTILRLMGPAVIAASAVQINVAVNSSFASFQGNGAVSWLGYAFRLMQLPLGIFGVAIATVTLPLVSKSAALGDMVGFRSVLSRAMRLAFFLTIPSAVGLICLSQPIIGLLYERGSFHHDSTVAVAAALEYYALGLAAYSGIKVLAPAFYALDARTTPMTVSFIAIAINVLLNSVLTVNLGWGYRGLALSTSATAVINFSLLYILMWRRMKRLETRQMFFTVIKILSASAFLAGVCVLGDRYVLAGFENFSLPGKCARLFVVIAAAGGVFFAVCYVLRLEEMREAFALVERKFFRRRKKNQRRTPGSASTR